MADAARGGHSYFSDFDLPPNLTATLDPAEALAGVKCIGAQGRGFIGSVCRRAGMRSHASMRRSALGPHAVVVRVSDGGWGLHQLCHPVTPL